MPNRQYYIYVMQFGDAPIYKIGQSCQPDVRLKTLQRTRKPPLKIAYLIPTTTPNLDESLYHRHFSEFKISGEWFYIPPEEFKWIEIIAGRERGPC